MASEESPAAGGLSRQNSGVAVSAELDPALLARNIQFVEKLEEQYVCPSCGHVVLNPHQTGCGHIFCYQCIKAFLESTTMPKCPIDNALIKANEVFQDNCCKREILNLEIYCANAPDCTLKVTLGRLQEHLKHCPYESVQCTNIGCTDVMFRMDLREHLMSICAYRMESCPHCEKHYMLIQLKDHEDTNCPDFKIQCPNKCSQVIKRHKLKDHFQECPQVEIDCTYKKYGCFFREKRVNVEAHEDVALKDHLLLVLESNFKLEKQIDDLQKTLLLKHHEFQELTSVVNNLEKEIKPLIQQVTKTDNMLSCVQRSLEEQRDRVSSVQIQLQQLTRAFNQDPIRTEVGHLKTSVDNLKQQVSVIESLKDRLNVLDDQYKRHSRLLNIHMEQLNLNDERFRQLEATSYNGKLIWKIQDFQKRKEAAAEGRAPSMFSMPFYTSRSGYKLCARAYLNGDGAGRGTHLSLYIVLMRGDFDSLLPWPFRQTVTLMILDQSGNKSDILDYFKPDPASNSFRRPTGEMNVASGFPCFVSHADLENPKNGVYVKDETLFVKVKVDTTGIEDL
uniref:TNF receptor-associated factor n=1 Tax=Lepisosteus oculatus TaxID=7918 RepID=W5NEW6_LEPOC|nr:PREDICTED: TNF receptor-associated factor 5 [Lepisosteus oculatus]XP_015217996.1 PREDICTED: TNF receptor-associated factor 5 [Lepisosteus oculatus]